MIYLLLITIGFSAAFLQSCIGFGAAIVMVNTLSLFLETAQSVAISQFSCIILSTYIVTRKFRDIRWKIILPMLIPSLICAAFFTTVSTKLQTGKLKLILGILFILLSFYFFLLASRIKLKPTIGSGITMGVISGSLNGLFAIGGPPAVLYLVPAIEEKNYYIASSQVFFLLTNTMSLSFRIALGKVTGQMLPLMCCCGLGALGGSLVGLKFTNKINGTLLKRLVYIFIGINGLIITFTSL